MGLLSTIFGFFGFGIGISIGLISGYFLFIYIQPTHVQVCMFDYVSFVLSIGNQTTI
jgi:hypothetical protein